ncbi:MAG: DUF354 domain-containing protein [Telluria sp.]|nr:DUF354 domain-containing protein [Telluria sp.]
MRFLIDICHPAHVHFFRHPVAILRERGHEVLITSRMKEVAIPLIASLGWEHLPLSCASSGKPLGILKELAQRDLALYRVVREFRPHAMAAIGGIFIAHAGIATRTPSVVFYDTETARLQNLLTYPFASQVVVPECYKAWLPKRSTRYRGYHELSYLRPERFTPNSSIAHVNGIDPQRDNYLIRLVSWQANHDIGERGWSNVLLNAVVAHLSQRGKVIISAEGRLPPNLQPLAYQGDPLQLHHVMAHCRLLVGESATMASEAAILGVPAIYAAHTILGYTTEQEQRYSLVRNIRTLAKEPLISAIEELLANPPEAWATKRAKLLADTIDVASYVADRIEEQGHRYPTR